MSDFQWIALLSDDTVAVEDEGEWVRKPGERLPWPRLAAYVEENDLFLKQLKFRNGDHFLNLAPGADYYFVQYSVQVDNIFGARQHTDFVDVGMGFGSTNIHYVYDLTNRSNSWIVASEGDDILAPIRGRNGRD